MRQVGFQAAITKASEMFTISLQKCLEGSLFHLCFAVLLLAVCCSSDKQDDSSSKDAGTQSDTEAETDSESEVDTNSDTNTNSDTDTDTDTEMPPGEWVTISAGSFLLGSPEAEPCRGAYTEEQVEVTLTRAFLMSQTEVTQAQWESVGLKNGLPEPHCSDCPVFFVNYFDSMAYCNKLSEKVGLDTCYDLSKCIGTPEARKGSEVFYCEHDPHKYNNWYDCPGYRLPTGAEWEYAARAGTTTMTYNGDITVNVEEGCIIDPAIDPIAWYCPNSDGKVHPVKQKKPNNWGLYDMIGNVSEWNDYVVTGFGLEQNEGREGPLTDPLGADYEKDRRRTTRGGDWGGRVCVCRSADHSGPTMDFRPPVAGFRPVRTLFE